MTICLVIKCKRIVDNEEKPSLLFASDTQESSLFLKRSVTKIRTIYGPEPKEKEKERWNMLVASAGDALIIDEVVEDIAFFLREKIDPDKDTPSISLAVYRKEIGDLAFATYKKYKDRDVETFHFELLIGTADKFSTILYVTNEGKNQVLDKFGLIGSGRITGGELLINEFLKESISEEEATSLAALVVTTVGHIDLSVGGGPDIRICHDRIVWVYKKPAFDEILKASESRWKLINRLWWKMQEDSSVEGKLEKLILGEKEQTE